jgi:hypothetical protein
MQPIGSVDDENQLLYRNWYALRVNFFSTNCGKMNKFAFCDICDLCKTFTNLPKNQTNLTCVDTLLSQDMELFPRVYLCHKTQETGYTVHA